ncbi:MAG: HAD-IIA family hydrolase [Acidimicrobiales bacterium]
MKSPRSWVIDLDGTVWRGRCAVPGSAEAIAELRRRGDHVLFATNHSALTRAELVEQLHGFNIPARVQDVHSSADAAVLLIHPGESVLVCATAAVEEAVRRRGGNATARGPAEAVIVGWHPEFDLDRLTTAVRAVLGGARLVATNDDALRPAPNGFVPGTGALVAAVETATGRTAVRAGKPHEPMALLLRPSLGPDVIVVGDSPHTDGGFARRLRARFALVLSGVTQAGAFVDPEPDLLGEDLHALVFG